MKKNSIFLVFCLFSFALVLPSCEDILDVDSARYVTVDDNEPLSSKDSINNILGLLRGLQNVAERYVLLGEVRADLLDVTVFTTADIRQLSDFTVEATSVYANPRDYYAIINNCNYFINRTSEAGSLPTENVLAHAIRAWTYMQVAFNWGKVYYFTEPLLSVQDTQKEYPEYTIPQLIETLIEDLEPLAEAVYPNYGTIYNFGSESLFFPMKVLLGDLYLWRGVSTEDYEKAATYYAEYIDQKIITGNGNQRYTISWSYENFVSQNFERAKPDDMWSRCTVASSSPELITAVQMAANASEGKVNRLRENYSYFQSSDLINDLWDDQSYLLHYVSSTATTDYYTTGDLRKQGNILGNVTITDATLTNADPVSISVLTKLYAAEHILINRLGTVFLRYAEAVNRAGKPHTAFAVLKYGLGPETFMDDAKIPRTELADNMPYITIFNTQKYTGAIGIHARGCGDSAFDINYTIGTDNEILDVQSDTIRRVEDLICNELALETSFEGNRFQDLMRISLRRNDPSFLAKPVATKHKEDYNRIYSLLSDTKNWFLPEPK
ncbi:MAG: hypothetical protein EZS26_000933 [Candidatus Ordinivivax streblomastigis]|uniref:Uncharacterized protein n=1 Tax=Candidatus Ordinivivax streblomastigis TaxID=2540710 RepID=A0A5M8P2T5_9BACT|nr:MAG: hypothetical protein EZS26_000933 [Candidatus Ordinivivax streblomastigis]